MPDSQVRFHRSERPALLDLCCKAGGATKGYQRAGFRVVGVDSTNLRSTVEVGVWRIPLEVQQRAMGIDWMTLEELSEAIPPAFTEHVGRFLMRAVLEQGTRAAA